MMPRTRMLLTLLLVAAASSACTPESLTSLGGDAGTGENNMLVPDADADTSGGGGGTDTGMMTGDTGGTGGTNNGGTNNGGGVASDEFMAVARIMAGTSQGCLLGGCHGDIPGPGVEFSVPGGAPSDDPSEELVAALYETLTTVNASNGTPLVVPNEPGSSEIYIRITSSEPYPVGMPTLPLPQEDIDTIGDWIAAGATF